MSYHVFTNCKYTSVIYPGRVCPLYVYAVLVFHSCTHILSTMPSVSFLPFLQQIPFATRITTGALVGSSLVALTLSTLAAHNTNGGIPSVNLPWLVMVPGESYWYPWTLLTAGWVELSFIGVSCHGLGEIQPELIPSWRSRRYPYLWLVDTWNEYGDGKNLFDSALS
jgi:hypothetical protein